MVEPMNRMDHKVFDVRDFDYLYFAWQGVNLEYHPAKRKNAFCV